MDENNKIESIGIEISASIVPQEFTYYYNDRFWYFI